MPNWCSTSYRLTGDTQQLETLYNDMKALQEMKKPLVPNGFGTSWLGCLVDWYGKDWKTFGCRGSWSDLYYDGKILSFMTETAWYRCPDVEDLLREKYPDIEIWWFTEEPGMEIYETNDLPGHYFPDRWLLDFIDESREGCYFWEYFATIEEAADFIRENCIPGIELEPTAEAIETALDNLQNERPDDISYLFKKIELV